MGYEVTLIDKQNKNVYLADGSSQSFDKLLIATGGNAFKPQNQGSNLNGIHYLRSAED